MTENLRRFDIFAVVPKNRNFSGRLYIESEGKTLRTIQVLARGSRGPGDTVFQKYGNTPTGVYDGSVFHESLPWREDSYGPHGEVVLKPIAGDALIAERKHGRTGILIHSGTLGGVGHWRGTGELRATRGCLRISNSDMSWLRREVFDGVPLACQKSRLKISVTVLEN